MSDLESNNVAAIPITARAAGKLQSFASGRQQVSQSDGLVDAFAEIFARMSESGKSIEPAPPSDKGSDQLLANDSSTSRETSSAESDDPADSERDRHDDSETHAVLIEDPDLTAQATSGINDVQSVTPETDAQSQYDVAEHDGTVLATETEDPLESNASESADASVELESFVDSPAANVRTQAESSDEAAANRQNSPEQTEQVGRLGERSPKSDAQETAEAEIDATDDSTDVRALETDSTDSSRSKRGRRHRSADRDPESGREVDRATRGQSATSSTANSLLNSEANSSAVADASVKTAAAAQRSAESSSIVASLGAASSGAASASANATASVGTGSNSAANVGSRFATQPSGSAAPLKQASGPIAEPKSKQSQTASTMSRVKLVQRVSKAFQHLGAEGGVVRLRLAPAEMGSVRVEMRINQRKVQARIVAETESATAALREYLPDLRARLESYGMQVEQIEVETETADQDRGSQFDTDSQQQPWRQNEERRQRFSPSPVTSEDSSQVSLPVSPAITIPTTLGVESGMDVHL